MTMFSMKPKFNLAEFLAENGPRNAPKPRFSKSRPKAEAAPVTEASPVSESDSGS